MFQEAKDEGIKISIHALEDKKNKADFQDILDFKPDWLGHCYFITKDETNKLIESKIPLEVCPTSNVAGKKCGTVEMLDHIPILYEKKHPMSVNCDDTMLFGTNLGNECFELAKALKFDGFMLKEFILSSIDSIFDQSLKKSLKIKVE
jgi:adenosine deaminase